MGLSRNPYDLSQTCDKEWFDDENKCEWCHKPTLKKICWKCRARLEELDEFRKEH